MFPPGAMRINAMLLSDTFKAHYQTYYCVMLAPFNLADQPW
jgi:hypothetical protein